MSELITVWLRRLLLTFPHPATLDVVVVLVLTPSTTSIRTGGVVPACRHLQGSQRPASWRRSPLAYCSYPSHDPDHTRHAWCAASRSPGSRGLIRRPLMSDCATPSRTTDVIRAPSGMSPQSAVDGIGPCPTDAHDQPPSCRDHPDPSSPKGKPIDRTVHAWLTASTPPECCDQLVSMRQPSFSPPEVADAVPIGVSKSSEGYAHYTTVVWNQSSAWPGAVVGCWVDISRFCALRSERCGPA
jgi:hypothetical protein